MPAMQPVPHVAICEGCDAVFQKPVLGPGEVARCSRCGTVLERHTGNAQRHILPMALAALLMFAVANLFPIIAITLGGQYSETSAMPSWRCWCWPPRCCFRSCNC
jgi:paraquat-inducible protein A